MLGGWWSGVNTRHGSWGLFTWSTAHCCGKGCRNRQHTLLPCTPTAPFHPLRVCRQLGVFPPPRPTWSSSASTPAQACRKRWWCCCTTDSTCSTAEAAAAAAVGTGFMDWTAPLSPPPINTYCHRRLCSKTPHTSQPHHTTPIPHAHLFRACCQQCPQVLSCVVDGLLTQLPQVGDQEALDSEGGVLKGQQCTRAVAQQLGQLCVRQDRREGWVGLGVLRAAAQCVCVCAVVSYLCWVHAPAQCARAACPSSWSAHS